MTITTPAVSAVKESDRLADFDFTAHNEEMAAAWKALDQCKPTRVPMILGTNTRYFMFNNGANPKRLTFRDYTEDPDVMFDMALEFQRWSRFNLLQDAELGLPERWNIAPDFQNYYEAAWFGCKVEYIDDQVPDTRPAFADNPEAIMDGGPPDPFGGIMGRAQEYFEHFQRAAESKEFFGRPIRANVPWCGCGTDGPLTVACNLFGPEFTCTAMIEEPARLSKLMDFITTATIARMIAWRKLAAIPVPQDNFGFADDSCALISTEMYREHVLPHHRKLCDAMGIKGSKRGIHLCGDVMRLFPVLRDELNIQTFDTGFPIDFAEVRKQLGPQVRINGGPHVEFLMRATPAQVRDEVKRILTSGIMDGGQFVLREGNNLAPHTPLENTEAMYHACREFGRYQ